MSVYSPLRILGCSIVALTMATPNLSASDGFSSLLTSRSRETFVAIRDYAARHTDAPDRPAAVRWLLETAPDWGWEADVIALAEQQIQAEESDAESVAMAQLVLALGLAQQGDSDAAVSVVEEFLRSLRFRNPNAGIDLCQSVSLRLQLSNDLAGATAVYDRLSAAFFLNQEVREAAQSRKARLELLGKPAPEISVIDVDGGKWVWDDHRNRVVVLDFWATTCRPCLDELPRLKQLARELQPRGLDVLGVSLDNDPAVVRGFRDAQRIPWQVALDAGKVAPDYRVRLIPCLMLVDRSGNIAAVDVPPRDLRWSALRLLDR